MLNDICVFILPEVPIQRKVKLPVILTPLPTPDEDRFFSKTNGEGAGHGSSKFNTQAKDKSDTNHDHSEHAQDIPKPRITEHDRPTQGGTNSKAHQHKPSAHYEMPSSGLRWTVYHLRTGDQNENKKRYKKRKKRAAPQQIDDDREEPVTDEDDGEEQSRSSVNFALVGAGIVVFLFIFAGLACLWYVALIFQLKRLSSFV